MLRSGLTRQLVDLGRSTGFKRNCKSFYLNLPCQGITLLRPAQIRAFSGDKNYFSLGKSLPLNPAYLPADHFHKNKLAYENVLESIFGDNLLKSEFLPEHMKLYKNFLKAIAKGDEEFIHQNCSSTLAEKVIQELKQIQKRGLKIKFVELPSTNNSKGNDQVLTEYKKVRLLFYSDPDPNCDREKKDLYTSTEARGYPMSYNVGSFYSFSREGRHRAEVVIAVKANYGLQLVDQKGKYLAGLSKKANVIYFGLETDFNLRLIQVFWRKCRIQTKEAAWKDNFYKILVLVGKLIRKDQEFKWVIRSINEIFPLVGEPVGPKKDSLTSNSTNK